jgi:membrane protein
MPKDLVPPHPAVPPELGCESIDDRKGTSCQRSGLIYMPKTLMNKFLCLSIFIVFPFSALSIASSYTNDSIFVSPLPEVLPQALSSHIAPLARCVGDATIFSAFGGSVMKVKNLGRVFKEAFHEFGEDKVLRLSAALAYYALFSLAPLVIIVIAIAGLFFGKEAVQGQVQEQLQGFFGQQGAQTIESMITAARKPSTSIIATILGVLTLLIGASGVFGQLQDALNTIWEVKPKPGRGIKGFLKDRFLSLAMVLGTGFLLLISMVLSAALAALSGVMNNAFGMPPASAHLLEVTVSLVVITLLFAMIFRLLPDAAVKWNDVWIGALFTALLFTLGKFVLGFYLGRESTASAYGAAGSLVVVLMWVYYSSIILFFGAEFTQVFAKERGSRTVPTPNAIGVTEETRGEEGIPHERAGTPAPAMAMRKQTQPARQSHKAAAAAQRKAVPAAGEAGIALTAQTTAQQEQAWKHIPKGSEVIQKKPWPFVSAAVGLGVLTGFVFKGEWLHRKKVAH